MFKFLVKKFIKDSENVTSPAVRTAYGTLCSVYGIFLNLVLFGVKYFAGVISGSMAVIADAFNNLSDAGSSIITLLGFSLAGKKPDPDHPFGHGRVEYLSGLVLSAVIMLTGFELGKSSVEKIIHPEAIEVSLLSAVILAAAILVKLYMHLYNRSTGKKIGSEAMLATAADSLTDCIATGVVLLSMGVTWLFKVNIDGYMGLLVAAFILYAGFGAARDTISPLLGKAPEKEFVKAVETIVMAHPEIVGIHDMLVHDYGPGRVIVSLHAEVPGDQDIYELHDAIDCAERELKEQCGCIATIHMDPIDTKSGEAAEYRARLHELVQSIHPAANIHDLRIVPGTTHTNLIFDIVVPIDLPMTDPQVETTVKKLVAENLANCFGVVNVDRDYVG